MLLAVAGDDLTLEENAEGLLAAAQAIQEEPTRSKATSAAAGTSSTMKGNTLERQLRDISVLQRQAVVSESRSEAVVGQAQPQPGAQPDAERTDQRQLARPA